MTARPASIAALAAFATLIAATPTFAHPGLHEHSTLLSGLTHPIGGADHLLAMVAVGVWSALAGGRNRVIWPLAFVTAMLGGFALAAAGLRVPLVEPGILASIVILGLMVALAVRVPTSVGAAIVAVFAVMHGAAHGMEAPAGPLAFYAAGFALATAGLHLAGLGLGLLARGRFGRIALRLGGTAAAAAGLALAFA